MPGNRVVLHHGTTRRRAEAILRDGPNSNFIEPGDFTKTEGFSAALAGGPFPARTPEEYAIRKSQLFLEEGGPAVVEFEVPEELMELIEDLLPEVRFDWGFGLEELIALWPTLPRRIL